MNNKPNVPGDILSMKPHAWSASLKAGGQWMFAVFLTDVPGAYLLEHHPTWPLAARAIIALLPLVAGLLYVRATARWVSGMDELDRRISLSSFLFAVVGYLVLATVWGLLDRAGVWTSIFETTNLSFSTVDFRIPTLAVALTYVLFGVGYTHIFNRRYQ